MIRKIGFFFLKKKFRVGPEFLGSVGEPETQVFWGGGGGGGLSNFQKHTDHTASRNMSQ